MELKWAGWYLMRKLCRCGNLCEKNGLDKNGNVIYRSKCSPCRKTGRAMKGDTCNTCGFIPVDRIQLDVDHIDGNPSNNDPLNVQTLCANCHRLKTKLNNDWKK
jgi:hypothetical protein